MSCCFEWLKTFSVFVFGIQLIFGIFRWLYENVVGPKFLEPTNLQQYGDWACKYFKNSDKIIMQLAIFLTPISAVIY